MTSELSNDLKKILLRRRNKVIVESDDNVWDTFKDNVTYRTSQIETFNDRCTIDFIDGINIKAKVDNINLEFYNGNVQSRICEMKKNEAKEEEIIDNKTNITTEKLIKELCHIIKEETNKYKKETVYALSLNENLNTLGYSMDEKLFNTVATLSHSEVKKLSNEWIPMLKEMVGANVTYNPLYPNFPTQVIKMKKVHLSLNALFHYWSNGTYIPYTKVEMRSFSTINVTYKNITIGKEKDLHDLMYNLMNAAESISAQGIKDLTTYFTEYEKFMDFVPDTIPNKENLAIITNLILTHSKEPSIEEIGRRFKTVTDVLRLAAILSGQSAGLCGRIRFKSFSNKERRLLMNLLNRCQNRQEDFVRYHNMWSRICERIHPKKFKNIYPDLVEDLLGSYKYEKIKDVYKKEFETYKKEFLSYKTIIKMYEYSKDKNMTYRGLMYNKEKYKNAFELVRMKNPDKETDETLNCIQKICHQNNFKKAKLNGNDDNNMNIPNLKLLEEKKNEVLIKVREVETKIIQCRWKSQSYLGKVYYLLKEKKYDKALELLSQRPGIFSKHLDELLDQVGDHDKVLRIFEEIAHKVSVKVLLSLKGYFQSRHEKLKVRVFLIKGKTPKMYFKKKVKEELDLELCEKICHICDMGLIAHFSGKEKMNKVFISEDLKKCVIPLDVRSANSSLETYSKGSRFDITYNALSEEEQQMKLKDQKEEFAETEAALLKNKSTLTELQDKIYIDKVTKVEERLTPLIVDENTINKIKGTIKILEKEISEEEERIKRLNKEIKITEYYLNRKTGNKIRLFIWWTNTKKGQRVDIDLSVMIFDENLCKKGHVSFTCLKNEKYEIYHSGDITNGGDVDGDGVAEFIDFDPEVVVKAGGRYIAVNIISYNGVQFNHLENCKFGWMEREDLNSNELFEPKTVRQKLDVTSQCTSIIPVLFDCKTREIIWVDTTLIEDKCAVKIEGSLTPMNGILYYYINPLRDNLYNLAQLHVQAREGEQVKTIEELSEGDIAFVSSLPYKCIDGVTYIRPTDLDIILSEYMT